MQIEICDAFETYYCSKEEWLTTEDEEPDALYIVRHGMYVVRMCMYTCMSYACACTHACCVHVCACTHVPYTCVCIHMTRQKCICMPEDEKDDAYIYIYIYIYIPSRYVCAYVCVCDNMCMCLRLAQ